MTSVINNILNMITNRTQDVLGSNTNRLAANDFPQNLWYNILMRCDKNTLRSATLVCRTFSDILHSSHFWIEKCNYDGIPLPPLYWRQYIARDHETINEEGDKSTDVEHSFDMKLIYYKNAFGRNLAHSLTPKSTFESLGRKGLLFDNVGSTGLAIESPPVGCAPSSSVNVCFATSYVWSRRYFDIDLVKAGIEPWILDQIRPTITVREQCCCRHDCAATYHLNIQLLKGDQTQEPFRLNRTLPRCQSVTKSWPQWEGGQIWETVECVFSEYPVGIRRICVMSSGKDDQFWAGHFGSKFSNTEVIISFPDDVRFKQNDEYEDPESADSSNGDDIPRMFSRRIPVGLRGRFRAHR